jgi:hypothetical protein
MGRVLSPLQEVDRQTGSGKARKTGSNALRADIAKELEAEEMAGGAMAVAHI